MRFPLTPVREARFAVFKSVLLVASTMGAGFGQVSYVRPVSFELGPFFGASYGIVNAQYMVGGNLTFAINKFILPYVEYSYLPQVAKPVLGNAATSGSPFTVNTGISFSDFHGGVHLRFPIHEKPIVPYLAFGVGALTHSSQSGTGEIINPSPFPPSPFNYTQTGGSDFAVNGGGGLRYYINQRYGLRVEAKVYEPTGTFHTAFGKVEFGIFYQFR
jgi:hypothetical protein